MRPYSRVYATVNLDHLAANMAAMRAALPPGTGMLGVVKADAYGHGSVPIARAMEPYVEGYAVATIPVGYGDGYMRSLSGRGFVLIGGRRAPILGRICMDQFMVDVTGIPGAAEDDEVTLLGRDGEDEITVEELARLGDGFHYEILCDIGKRVPRVYLRDGKIVGTKDYFDDSFGLF